MFGTGAGIYRNVLGVLSSAISAVRYRIVGKGQRSDGSMDGRCARESRAYIYIELLEARPAERRRIRFEVCVEVGV